ncbi:MAG: glycosyltransferase family 1 protein [Cupriavidus sp.]|nr:MAG: glycosyltransferase family 1 protein [Cupriavidus sp.]
MSLAVDARLLAGHPRGMGQYGRALLRPVASQALHLLPATHAGPASGPVLRAGHAFEPWWEQCVLPSLVRRAGVDALLCPANTAPVLLSRKTRLILVVHDLIYMEPLSTLPLSRSAYQNMGRLYRRLVVPRAIRAAHRIVVVSAFTGGQLQQRFGVAPERITLIPNSVDEAWFADAPVPEAERGAYLLAVAGEAPSKNLPGLLQAFARLVRHGDGMADVSLRVAGVKPDFHAAYLAQARRLSLQGRVVFEGPVPTEELRRLYRHARGFVMPSLFEGFGIPLLEAMASGTPVACSATTSMPEVAGGCAWLFDPRDPNDMAKALLAMLQDTDARVRYVREGLMQARRYGRAIVNESIERFWNSVHA